MTKGEIEKMFCEAASTRDFVRRRQLLDALVKEDPENRDVQGAQAMLGGLYFQGRGGAPRDFARAEALLSNPARHGHSQALLQIALIHYQTKKPDAVRIFAQAWAAGGNGSEAAATKLEELRRAGTGNPSFMQFLEGQMGPCVEDVQKKIREGKDPDGSRQIAMALYYIYELGGSIPGHLSMARDCLEKALEQGNALAASYLKRTAFDHMENPEASARLMDANRDYTPERMPVYEAADGNEAGDYDSGEGYIQKEEKHSFFSAANMPYTIQGPYNHTYHRLAVGIHSADYICEEDGDMVTIRDEDITVGIMGYSANTASGYFYW